MDKQQHRAVAVTTAERIIMYYKFKAFKNNIENEKYSIDVFDRKQRDYYTKQYLHYVKVGIFDRFTVLNLNALKEMRGKRYENMVYMGFKS